MVPVRYLVPAPYMVPPGAIFERAPYMVQTPNMVQAPYVYGATTIYVTRSPEGAPYMVPAMYNEGTISETLVPTVLRMYVLC